MADTTEVNQEEGREHNSLLKESIADKEESGEMKGKEVASTSTTDDSKVFLQHFEAVKDTRLIYLSWFLLSYFLCVPSIHHPLLHELFHPLRSTFASLAA